LILAELLANIGTACELTEVDFKTGLGETQVLPLLGEPPATGAERPRTASRSAW
jgi:hypothetical protein